jgi:hypothetical protein
MSNNVDEGLLSAPHTKRGKLQRACLEVLKEHERDDALPTNGQFLWYELVQKGVVLKREADSNRKRTPKQNIVDALTWLRDKGIIPWWWIADETRSLDVWEYAKSVYAYAANAVEDARIDLWAGELPPLIICETRATKGVLMDLASEYLVPITATGGQCRAFLINEVAPLLEGNDRRVAYIGDHEVRGPADQIEAHSRQVLEDHAYRVFDDHTWERIALTQAQVNRSPRLRNLAITKYDKRYCRRKDGKRIGKGKPYQAIECEAMKQTELVKLVRKWLDKQLPEPIAPVRVREDGQRDRVRALVEEWADDDQD